MASRETSGGTTKRRKIADPALNSAVDQSYMSTVFHDLKAPLATIMGALELLALEKKKLNADQRELIDLATCGGKRLNELLDDAHMLASLESGKIQPQRETADIGAIVREVVEGLESPDTVVVTVDCPTPASVFVDRDLFALAVRHLLSNAVKYSPNGGTVVVAVRRGNDATILSVEDHGVGIPAREIPAIFRRFHRAERAETQDIEGTGLGLAVVKMIVERHGGSVDVRSVEGKGATFTVALPTT